MEFATWYDRLAQDGGDAVDALVDAAEDEEERLFVATHAWYFRRHPNPAQHLFERAWAEGPESRVGRAAAEWLRTRTRTRTTRGCGTSVGRHNGTGDASSSSRVRWERVGVARR